MSVSPFQLLAGASLVWILNALLKKSFAVKSIESQLRVCPGGSVIWVRPFSALAHFLGPFFPFKGKMGYYFDNFSAFQRFGSTCISSVLFWDAIPVFWLSDAQAIKAVHMDRSVFPKEVQAYEVSNFYGPNMLGTEGAEWKRHRHSANSAFNEKNNALVWSEAITAIDGWFTEIDNAEPLTSSEVSVDLSEDLTQVTLLIICAAAFGRRSPFKDDHVEVPLGHKLALRPAVSLAFHNAPAVAITPKFLWNLSQRIHIPLVSPFLKKCSDSFSGLGAHVLEIIASARDITTTGQAATMDSALLRNLVQANMMDDTINSKNHLSDDELLSNAILFLLAGHETTSHSLSFAIVILALHPDLQQQMFEETLRLWPDDIPTADSPPPYKETMAKLEFTLAFFQETLRHFPPVGRLSKIVATDTTLPVRSFTTDADGKISNVQQYDVDLKCGSMILIDIRALHFNPIHWGDDVDEFKPSRFIDTNTYRWPRDAFNAFSSGPRSCIGMRFSLTESACILAHVVRKYEVGVPSQLRNKPWAEQKKIMLDWVPGITATPKNAHVTFRRRQT